MKLTYTTLHELPLKRYIDCVCDNNLRSLLRVPIPCPKSRLRALYEALIKEYEQLSGNKEYAAKKNAIDELNEAKRTVYLYENALQLISDFDDMNNAMEYLHKEGFRGTREQVIKRVEAEIKAMTVRIELKESQLRVENPTNKEKKATRSDYNKTILAINKNGYRIIDYKSTVALFIDAMNMQREEAKQLDNQLKKKR